MKILVAGGGTAGHIEPAMNFADEVMRQDPTAQILAVGTARGLESELIPKRGYELALIDPVPMPRRPNRDLVSLPFRLRKSVGQVRDLIESFEPDVVVGFGGYVSIPVYLGARGRVPVVVHEANAHAGLANKVGARFADAIAETVSGSLPNAEVIGIPLRHAIAELDRGALRAEARSHFGLPEKATVIFAFGGSQGSVRINQAIEGAVTRGALDGCAVLHSVGAKNEIVSADQIPANTTYVGLNYIDRMDLAYAASDFIVARSGAMTVAEVTAVGLPACYVPYPVGNGEQKFNALPVVHAGGALLIDDQLFTSDAFIAEVLPIATNETKREAMARAALSLNTENAAAQLVDLVRTVVTNHTGRAEKG